MDTRGIEVPYSADRGGDSLRKGSSWGKSMPWLAPRWFPPFQEQAIVGDHRPVIRCFARTQLQALPFMLRQGFPRALQRPRRA